MPRLLLYHFGFNIIYIFSKKKTSYIKPIHNPLIISKPLLVHFNGLVLYSNSDFWILNPIQLFEYGLNTLLNFKISKHSSKNNLRQPRPKVHFLANIGRVCFLPT